MQRSMSAGILCAVLVLVGAACAPPPDDGGSTTTTAAPQEFTLTVDPEGEVEDLYIFDIFIGQAIAQGAVLGVGDECTPFGDDGSGNIAENDPCEYSVTEGSVVELSAVPFESAECGSSCTVGELSLVGEWTGCDEVPSPDTCVLTVDGPRTVSHTFLLP